LVGLNHFTVPLAIYRLQIVDGAAYQIRNPKPS
jgi:hypothetical protein